MEDQSAQLPQKKETRRNIVKKIGVGTLGAAALSLLPNSIKSVSAEVLTQSKKEPHPSSAERAMNLKDLEAAIVTRHLDSASRFRAEEEYVFRSKTLKDIDRGFMMVVEPSLRAQLLDRRWILRESGEDKNLPKLDKSLMDWSVEQGIHPEVLAACVDTYNDARTVIQKLLDNPNISFRPKAREQIKNGLSIDNLLINVGGMARLVITETGGYSHEFVTRDEKIVKVAYGFSNIGIAPAMNEINEESKYFVGEKDKLRKVAAIMKEDTGIPFDPDQIPGSARMDRDKNISGGAIGLQFMPQNVLMMRNLLDKVGHKFNAFDIKSSLVGGWVFLAMNGYMKGEEKVLKDAIRGWNNWDPQIKQIYDTAVDFYDRFMAKQNRDKWWLSVNQKSKPR